jgi:hypothetical protein
MPRINGLRDTMGNLSDVNGLAVPDNLAVEDQPMNGLSRINPLRDSNMGATASIHEIVSETLAKLGFPAPATIIQTMLMKDGYFAGYKFRYDGGYAIYLAGGGII